MLEIVARVLFFVFATLVAIGGVALLADAVWRRLLSTRPDMDLHPCQRGDSDVTFVILPTYQERTKLLMMSIIRQVADYGTVYRIDGAPRRFDAAKITCEILGLTAQDRRIVIIAPGSGLMLAVDLALLLEEAVGREVSVISIDGIPSSSYISSTSLEMARLPLGPIANWVTCQMRRFKKWTRWNTTPSLWRDYMKYIRTWYPKGQPKATLIYIRSEHTQDDSLFMAPNLAGHLVADGLVCTITVPDADELDIPLYPQQYETAVARALELLEIARVG